MIRYTWQVFKNLPGVWYCILRGFKASSLLLKLW